MRLLASTPIVVSAPTVTLTSPTLRIPRTGQDAILAGVAQTSLQAERPRVVFRARPDTGSIIDWTAQLQIESWDSQGGTRIVEARDVSGLLYWASGTIEVDLRSYAIASATLALAQWQGAATTMRAQTVAIDACGESGDAIELGSKTGTGSAYSERRLAVAVPTPAPIYWPSGRAFFVGAIVMNTGAIGITATVIRRSGTVSIAAAPIAIAPGGASSIEAPTQTLGDLWGLTLAGGPSTADIAYSARGP